MPCSMPAWVSNIYLSIPDRSASRLMMCHVTLKHGNEFGKQTSIAMDAVVVQRLICVALAAIFSTLVISA